MNTFVTFCDYMAFGLGNLGIPLTYIGVYRPDLVVRIEKFLDLGAGDQDDVGTLQRAADRMTRTKAFLVILILNILISMPLISWKLISKYSQSESEFFMHTVFWVLIFILVGLLLVFLSFYFFSWLVRTANAITNGHAFDGIGIFVLILGAFGDNADKILSWIFDL